LRPRVEVLPEDGVWTRVEGRTGEERGDGSTLCDADWLEEGFSESACRFEDENKDARRFLPFLNADGLRVGFGRPDSLSVVLMTELAVLAEREVGGRE